MFTTTARHDEFRRPVEHLRRATESLLRLQGAITPALASSNGWRQEHGAFLLWEPRASARTDFVISSGRGFELRIPTADPKFAIRQSAIAGWRRTARFRGRLVFRAGNRASGWH